MALLPCRECGQQVSTEASICPHCGVGRPTEEPAATPVAQVSTPGSSNSVVVGVLIGIGILALIFAAPSILRSMGRSSLTGGKTDAVVTVRALPDVCWTANIGSASQEGCGDRSFPVHDALGLFSSNVQKKSAGAETIWIDVKIDNKTVATNSTSAAYGIAQVVVSP